MTLNDVEHFKKKHIERWPQYPVPKWLMFCESLLNDDWAVDVYKSQSTVSKYVYIKKGKRIFKVRFSNHKPSREKQIEEEDCDFYVGVSNNGALRTEVLLKQLKEMET